MFVKIFFDCLLLSRNVLFFCEYSYLWTDATILWMTIQGMTVRPMSCRFTPGLTPHSKRSQDLSEKWTKSREEEAHTLTSLWYIPTQGLRPIECETSAQLVVGLKARTTAKLWPTVGSKSETIWISLFRSQKRRTKEGLQTEGTIDAMTAAKDLSTDPFRHPIVGRIVWGLNSSEIRISLKLFEISFLILICDTNDNKSVIKSFYF